MVCVEGDGAAPPELRLAWMCGDSKLPEAGGVYDQNFVTLNRMTAAVNIYNIITRMQGLVGEQIHSLTRSERKLIRWLRDEGYL